MKRYEQGSVGMRPDPEGSWCDYTEARDEIERLRADLDDQKKDTVCDEQRVADLMADVQRLGAENERLRCDLADVTSKPFAYCTEPRSEILRRQQAEIERLREELDSLGKAFIVAINAATDESLRHYCEKEGWDFEATRALGRPVAAITDPELVRVLNLDTRDTDIQRFEKALMVCQEDREKAHIRADRLRELLRSISVRLILMRGPSLLKGPEDRLIAGVLHEIEGALGDE